MKFEQGAAVLVFYATVDAEALVDLGAYGRFSAWRAGWFAFSFVLLAGVVRTSTCQAPLCSTSADPGARCTEVAYRSQLIVYMMSCQGGKCSVLSCYGAVHGARRGAPLCRKHLANTAHSLSPASNGPRVVRAKTPVSSLPSSGTRFEGQDGDQEATCSRNRFSTQRSCPPTPSSVEPLTFFLELQVAVPGKGPVLLRLRLRTDGACSLGRCSGYPRQSERLLVERPLNLLFSVPAANVEAAPYTGGNGGV